MTTFLAGLGIFVLILLCIFYVLPLFGTWITIIIAVRMDTNFKKEDSWVIWLLAIVAVVPILNIMSFIGMIYVITQK